MTVVTEVEVVDRLLEFRSKQTGFIGTSFDTISGSGANGAIIHYKPESDSCSIVDDKNLFLLDSGGQYVNGTTDITRTVHFGELTARQKECFTRVLQLTSKRVKLLDMYGSQVAIGIVMSIDPTKIMMGRPIGQDFCEVVVLLANKLDSPLFIKDHNRKTMKDAIGSHILGFLEYLALVGKLLQKNESSRLNANKRVAEAEVKVEAAVKEAEDAKKRAVEAEKLRNEESHQASRAADKASRLALARMRRRHTRRPRPTLPIEQQKVIAEYQQSDKLKKQIDGLFRDGYVFCLKCVKESFLELEVSGLTPPEDDNEEEANDDEALSAAATTPSANITDAPSANITDAPSADTIDAPFADAVDAPTATPPTADTGTVSVVAESEVRRAKECRGDLLRARSVGPLHSLTGSGHLRVPKRPLRTISADTSDHGMRSTKTWAFSPSGHGVGAVKSAEATPSHCLYRHFRPWDEKSHFLRSLTGSGQPRAPNRPPCAIPTDTSDHRTRKLKLTHIVGARQVPKRPRCWLCRH
ncbi:hypothetical protein Taro_052259 [Colocasia esculenta]|uniref:Uncharacterized protein n=1 Tax=Colocasia esculenta TaxID=4460 RepID=A0A843XHZ4_COLES|nr:hypothetical protein [Colocasia esculenta]